MTITVYPCAKCGQGAVFTEGDTCRQCDNNQEPHMADTETAPECKLEGCTQPARQPLITSGRFSRLCQQHYDEVRAAMSSDKRGKPHPRKNGRAPHRAVPTNGLVAAAQRVEAARQALTQARRELDEAKANISALLELES